MVVLGGGTVFMGEVPMYPLVDSRVGPECITGAGDNTEPYKVTSLIRKRLSP